ncbi:MAG: tRNA (adenosine(37)-N6)-dimethylallyltransferase MiaA [Planctomycetota bacterium]
MSAAGHPPVLILTGATASGKGSFAVTLAAHLGVPLISLDSMKVYRGMDIGTAKPAAETTQKLPIHLIDIRDPWEGFSVGDYLRELESLAERLPQPWIFCGGCAFYLYALTEGIFQGPTRVPELRRKYQEEAARLGVQALHERLAGSDPAAAAKIHPGDLRRIVRALEVMEVSGELISELQTAREPLLPSGCVRIMAWDHPRQSLYRRIDERVEAMFQAGWVEEVEVLLAAHDPPWGAEAAQSIGYAQIREALHKRQDPRERIQRIQQRTRNFARSQLVWFRRMSLEWWNPDDPETLVQSIERSLEEYREHGRFQ